MTRTGRFLATLPVLAAMALAPVAANAQYYRGHGGYYGGYRGGYGYGHRGFGVGPFVGGALLGLGVGAIVAGPRYYAPPPVVYAPPPVVYAAPPAYYAPPYYAPGYYPPAYPPGGYAPPPANGQPQGYAQAPQQSPAPELSQANVPFGSTCYAGVYVCAAPAQTHVGSGCSCPGLGAPSYGVVQ